MPEDAITITITEHAYTNKDSTSDQYLHHNISCCVSIEVEGITSAPSVNWHYSHGEKISEGDDIDLQHTTDEKYYCAFLQFSAEACGGELLCRAELSHNAISTPLVKTMGYNAAHPTGGNGTFKSYSASLVYAVCN